MHIQSDTCARAVAEARLLRARAISGFWQQLRDAVSLHVPRLFPSEF